MAEVAKNDRSHVVGVEAEMKDRPLGEIAVHVATEKRWPERQRQAPETPEDPELGRTGAGLAPEPVPDPQPCG